MCTTVWQIGKCFMSILEIETHLVWVWVTEFFQILKCTDIFQFEYQQAQLEAEIENLSWKIERAETTDRGDLENQMDIAEKRRTTLLKDFLEVWCILSHAWLHFFVLQGLEVSLEYQNSELFYASHNMSYGMKYWLVYFSLIFILLYRCVSYALLKCWVFLKHVFIF